MGGKCLRVCVCVCVWQRMTDGPAGRSRGRWMRWQTETDSPLSLRHNPSFSLPLFSFSACRDDAVPLVLLLRGGEGRGEDGEKEKRKKLHSSGINVYFGPPLRPLSFALFPLFLRFHPLFSCLSSFSFPFPPHPLSPPPFADQESVVSIAPFGVIQLAVGYCFFFATILIISKEFLPPWYTLSYLISVRTHLPERIFLWARAPHSFR